MTKLEQVQRLWQANDNEWEELVSTISEDRDKWKSLFTKEQTAVIRQDDKVESLSIRNQKLANENERLKSASTSSEREERLRTYAQNLVKEVRRLEADRTRLQDELDSVRDSYGDLSSEYAAFEERHRDRFRLLGEAQERARTAEAKVKALEVDLRSLREVEQNWYNTAIRHEGKLERLKDAVTTCGIAEISNGLESRLLAILNDDSGPA
jgi:chromosome segregation ATPase